SFRHRGFVSSERVEIGIGAAVGEETPDAILFQLTVLPILHHGRRWRIWFSPRHARLVINWPAIVRVDQRKIPKFRPLIEVRNPGQGALENSPGDADQNATKGKPSHEWSKYLHETTARREELHSLVDENIFIVGIGRRPACPSL